MKKPGDIIKWETKGGLATGEIVEVKARYTYVVRVEPECTKYVEITEYENMKI